MPTLFTDRPSLRTLLATHRCLRVLEAHSAMCALLAQHVRFATGHDSFCGYDAIWSSSLADSTLRGLPDIEILNAGNRLPGVRAIFDVCSLPLIFDGDTGGCPEHFELNVRALEGAGVSAVVIEDKRGLKKNSLLGNDAEQRLDSIDAFCTRLHAGKRAQRSPEFMVFARCESLVLDAGMDDALRRCSAYVSAGADGILIHSRKADGHEVMAFARRFRAAHATVPLMCVPTSYAHVHFDDMQRAGFNVVVYANHMLRSAYLAMRDVATGILRHGRTLEMEPRCLGIDEILDLIPGTR